jgi:7,8-dihydroneopterin aldolase/epimerase/oxygenase
VETVSPDHIHIEQLVLNARVGVTEAERSKSQPLAISLTLWPRHPLVDLADDLQNTINYSQVCDEVKEFARGRADKLIETLADRLAAHLLARFAIQRITIEVRKFVRPDAEFVAVTLTRNAAGN